MSIQKEYPKDKKVCRVTFMVPEFIFNGVKRVCIVGEFNNWSTTATPMKRGRNGSFSATLDLQRGHEYQFRYLVDGDHWENENEADKVAPTPFGNALNSVIVV